MSLTESQEARRWRGKRIEEKTTAFSLDNRSILQINGYLTTDKIEDFIDFLTLIVLLEDEYYQNNGSIAFHNLIQQSICFF